MDQRGWNTRLPGKYSAHDMAVKKGKREIENLFVARQYAKGENLCVEGMGQEDIFDFRFAIFKRHEAWGAGREMSGRSSSFALPFGRGWSGGWRSLQHDKTQ
jgi:hypothetical protein